MRSPLNGFLVEEGGDVLSDYHHKVLLPLLVPWICESWNNSKAT